MTRGQARALASHRATFVSPLSPTPVDWSAEFGRDAPLGLEIGFGMGGALLEWAAACPHWNLLGIDVYQPGIGALLLGVESAELTNLRVIEGDARLAVAHAIAPESLDEVRIFFPDPWPKKRHHKRRLIQADFARLLVSRLRRGGQSREGGQLRLATDWQPYASAMREVLDAVASLQNAAGDGFAPRPVERPLTRFEIRGRRLGHQVWDLAYRRR
jgi:tRNA (guanine-N7-)-methyltransferase